MQNLEKHSRLPRKVVERPSLKRVAPPPEPIAPEVKAEILEDTRKLLSDGWPITAICQKHSLEESALNYWMLRLGDSERELRAMWLDSLLSGASYALKQSDDPMSLAKGREYLKWVMWLAEKIDRKRYGEDKAPTAIFAPVLNITVSAEAAPAGRVIEGEKPQLISEAK